MEGSGGQCWCFSKERSQAQIKLLFICRQALFHRGNSGGSRKGRLLAALVSIQIFTSLWNHTSIFLALKAAVKERERECESADKDSFLIFLHCLTAQKVCFCGCVPSSVSSDLLFCQVTKGGRTCPEVLSCALSL